MSEFMPHVVSLDASYLQDAIPPDYEHEFRRVPLMDRYKRAMSTLNMYASGEEFAMGLSLSIEQNWLLLNRPYYKVAPGIAAAFLNTQLNRVALADVRLPYAVMEVRFPDIAALRFANDEKRLTSALLSVVEARVAPHPHLLHDAERSLCLLVNYRNDTTNSVHISGLFNNVEKYCTLSDAINSFEYDHAALPQDTVESAYAIALSAAFYATGYAHLLEPELLKLDAAKAASADEPTVAKLAEKARRRGVVGFLLGGPKYDIRVRRQSQPGSYIKGNGEKRQFQYWRCGHWKRQRYGPGRKKTRIIWIEPVLCCPDLPPDPRTHGYVVAA